MKENPEQPALRITAVGFKLTPSIQTALKKAAEPLGKASNGLIRIRTKLRFFDNGPRRDTFQVRMRIEQRGEDLVTILQGHDLYQIIQKSARITCKRLKDASAKRQANRRQRHLKPA